MVVNETFFTSKLKNKLTKNKRYTFTDKFVVFSYWLIIAKLRNGFPGARDKVHVVKRFLNYKFTIVNMGFKKNSLGDS